MLVILVTSRDLCSVTLASCSPWGQSQTWLSDWTELNWPWYRAPYIYDGKCKWYKSIQWKISLSLLCSSPLFLKTASLSSFLCIFSGIWACGMKQNLFPDDTSGKETCLPWGYKETRVLTLTQEDPLEEGMATHPSILSWRIPWTEEPDGLQSMGVAKSRTWLKQL